MNKHSMSPATIAILLVNDQLAMSFKGISENTRVVARQFPGEPWAAELSGNGNNEDGVKSLEAITEIQDQDETVYGIELGQKLRYTAATYSAATAKMGLLEREIPSNSKAFQAVEQTGAKVREIVASKAHYAQAFKPAQDTFNSRIASKQGSPVTLLDVQVFYTSIAIACLTAAQSAEAVDQGNKGFAAAN